AVGDAAGAARGISGGGSRPGPAAAAVPLRRTGLGTRPRPRGGAERKRRLTRERTRALLDDAATARPRDLERRGTPHRRPDGIGDDILRRARLRIVADLVDPHL